MRLKCDNFLIKLKITPCALLKKVHKKSFLKAGLLHYMLALRVK